MNHLSLFSGIGGLDLGLERAGMTTVGQVERDDYCRSVLARHWPDVPRHNDVDTAVSWWTGGVRPTVDVVSGGFPCQPFSLAGKRQGALDDRWKWPAMRAVVQEVRPSYVIAENVPGLLRDGEAFVTVLEDLSALGYLVQWSIVSACSVGSPFVRRRLFIVASPAGEHGAPWLAEERSRRGEAPVRQASDSEHASGCEGIWLETPPLLDRAANGLASRMVAAGGNAVVPRVAEHIGRLVVEHHRTRTAAL